MISPGSKLRNVKFVRDVEAELQRRGFQKAGNLPGDYTWRRSSAWQHPEFRLRVEIRAEHELRLRYPDGKWRISNAKDFAEAIEILDAGEGTARFGDD